MKTLFEENSKYTLHLMLKEYERRVRLYRLELEAMGFTDVMIND